MKACERSQECSSRSFAAAREMMILPDVACGTGAKESSKSSPSFIRFPITTSHTLQLVMCPVAPSRLIL
eukprot:1212144-Rhodomonas_salina.1